jgi:hypothetical protein
VISLIPGRDATQAVPPQVIEELGENGAVLIHGSASDARKAGTMPTVDGPVKSMTGQESRNCQLSLHIQARTLCPTGQ